MERLLKEIADIQAGYSFRGTIPVSKNGTYRVIQIKDVGYDGTISNNELVKVKIDSINSEYLTAAGDILFTSRGTTRRAAVIDKKTADAIFVSQLYALKIRTAADAVAAAASITIPEYLAWYLNQPPAQEFFEANSSGSYIQNIRRDVLANLPVKLPPVKMQRKIVNIYRLGLREKEIAEKVLIKRRQVTESALLALVRKQQ